MGKGKPKSKPKGKPKSKPKGKPMGKGKPKSKPKGKPKSKPKGKPKPCIICGDPHVTVFDEAEVSPCGSGCIRPRQGTEICNFGVLSPLEFNPLRTPLSQSLTESDGDTLSDTLWPLLVELVLTLLVDPCKGLPLQCKKLGLVLCRNGFFEDFKFFEPPEFLQMLSLKSEKAHKHKETHRTSPDFGPLLKFFMWGAPSPGK